MAKHWSLFLSTDFYKLECYSNKCVALTGKTNYIKIISLLIDLLLPVSFILQYWLCLKWPSRLWSAESSVKHLVFLLGAAAASLIVEHSEQHPQVQQGHRYEPHQNCGKEKRWSETRKADSNVSESHKDSRAGVTNGDYSEILQVKDAWNPLVL